jgi:hypothetical protein
MPTVPATCQVIDLDAVRRQRTADLYDANPELMEDALDRIEANMRHIREGIAYCTILARRLVELLEDDDDWWFDDDGDDPDPEPPVHSGMLALAA